MGFRAGIGQSDFRKLHREGMDIIDKSPLIVDLVKDPAQVVLFPRPRRFGKTTNLSMLRYFFETSTEDRSALFDHMQVWQSPEARAHFQKYPVIWLSLKDVKADNWGEAFAQLRMLLQELLLQHHALVESTALSQTESDSYRDVMDGSADVQTFAAILKHLSRWLSVRPIRVEGTLQFMNPSAQNTV